MKESPKMQACRIRHPLRWIALFASCGSTLIGPAALAQEAVVEPSGTWKFNAALGLASRPEYPGSADTKTSAFPMLSANYDRYFIGGLPEAGVPVGLGVNLVQDAHWRMGLGLGVDLDKPREESDSARLQGMGDIDGTTHGAVFASYSDSWWKVGGNVVTDLAGKNQGTRASLNFEVKYSPMARLELSAGPSVTWADSKYAQTFFGVTAAQSASSGLSPYTAKSGINQVNFNIAARYQLNQQWGLGARFSAGTLRGDAVDSPITEKKSQNTLAVFANYRF